MKAFVIDVSICNGCYNCPIDAQESINLGDITLYAVGK